MNSPDFDFDDTPAEKPAQEVESFEIARSISETAPQIEFPLARRAFRPLPSNLDAEAGLLGSIFADSDGSSVLQRCLAQRITRQSFYSPRYGMVYATILKLHAAQQPIDPSTVLLELFQSPDISRGDAQVLVTEVSMVSTTIQAEFYLRKVRQAELQREMIRAAHEIAEGAFSESEGIQEFIADAHAKMQCLVEGSAPEVAYVPVQRPLFDFALVKDGDPSILLGNRYVNRGDSFIIVSSSGMGKSSLSLQFAVGLALELSPFTIKGNGRLRSLVVQSEDSDGDIAEVAHSLIHALKLTPEQIAIVNENVRIVSDRVNRGPAFLASLKKHIEEFKPDIVWINPLQAFIVGDVTKAEDLGLFLREGLNGLNKECKFAWGVVHHTTKPATGKDKGSERLWHEVMYDMAGGAELINWARAIISIRPDKNEGEFNMVLAKRGKRAGAKILNDHDGVRQWEYTTTIPLRHCKDRLDVPGIKNGMPVIFWEVREKSTDGDSTSEPDRGGRSCKYNFNDFANLFPEHSSAGMELSVLHRALERNAPINKKTLHTALKRWETEGNIEVLIESDRPMRYRKMR